jgi:hypothetical protein
LADQIRRKARGKPPFSRHPLFPAVLALWGGAILALAGLVLAPGLALTGRAMLALGLGVIGALLGIVLARRIRTPKASAEDDGAQGPDLTADRRALTYEEPVRPDPAEPARPAIDREPQVLAVAEFEIEGWNEILVEAVGDQPDADHAPAPDSAAGRIARADLSDLSPVELLERLALSMQRRRRALGEAPLAGIGLLPETHSGAAAIVVAEDERESGRHEDGYSSLLDMGRLPRLRSLAGGAGPGVPDAPAGETEDALRAALTALRKMSGAA